jgi:hypothetical protein
MYKCTEIHNNRWEQVCKTKMKGTYTESVNISFMDAKTDASRV